ncbi:MAG TPA: VCBS repeat-containing protein, partial [Planctomycetota bacterium]
GNGGEFGGSVGTTGDVDGDGVPDLLVGARSEAGPLGSGQGRVVLVSGATGGTLAEWRGTNPWAYFGATVAGAGDLDGDGTPDLLIGEPGNNGNGGLNGAVHALSGANGATLHQFQGGSREKVGGAVANAGDVDADGTPDIVFGVPVRSSIALYAGAVEIRSGRTGALIYEIPGWQDQDLMGSAVAAAGDWNGDGFADVAMSAPIAFGTGVVIVVSGADGRNLAWLRGLSASDAFGQRLAAAGDVDADGVPDLLVGAPSAGLGHEGAVAVISGRTQLNLAVHHGSKTQSFFGVSLASLGDLDGDGHAEYALGAPREDGLEAAAGAVHAWSCGELELLAPTPGLAGMDNLLAAHGASPGALVYFVWGMRTGRTPVPGCPGVVLDLGDPRLAGTAAADSMGVARLIATVPAAAAGHAVLLQAVEIQTYRASRLLAHHWR